MDKKIIKAIEKINYIFKCNNISLIDEFEEEFIKLENEKETSSMIILGNRELIRNSFVVLVMLYGERASLKDFKILINNTNGNAKKMILEFSKININNKDIQFLLENIYEYFMNDYYGGTLRKNSDTYKYCLPTRYLLDKMLIKIEINEGKFSDFKIKENNITIKSTKNLSSRIKLIDPIGDIEPVEMSEKDIRITINNNDTDNVNDDFDILMEDLEDDLM